MYHITNHAIKYRVIDETKFWLVKNQRKTMLWCFVFIINPLHSCIPLLKVLSFCTSFLLSLSHFFLRMLLRKVVSLISYWLKIANPFTFCVKGHVARWCFHCKHYRGKTWIGLPLTNHILPQRCCLFTMYLNSITGRTLVNFVDSISLKISLIFSVFHLWGISYLV